MAPCVKNMTYKILAVDDHPQTLDIIVLTLSQYGFDVTSTQSPVEALQLAPNVNPDLILLDMSMPEMDGLEVCRSLRAMSQFATTPIIMFTAEDEPHQKLAGFDAGADDYLTKPTDPDEMIARIEAMLESAPTLEESDDVEMEADLTYKETILIPEQEPAVEMTEPGQSNLVAVLGVRGGAGTTLTAINLAASIARHGRLATLVDMDMTQGHIALYLNRQISGSLNTLADLPHDNIREWLPQQMAELSAHMRLLLAQPNYDGRFSHLSPLQTEAILDILSLSNHTIVVDIGQATTEAQQLVLNRADQIIVCLPPERIALLAAKQRLAQLQKNIPPFATLHTIVFNINDQMNLPLKAVETYLEHPIHAVIAISGSELTQTVNRGDILVRAFGKGKTAKQFYQLAGQYSQSQKG